jgi:hypothetical protein
MGRQRDEHEVSKADQSDNWGSDRATQAPGPRGGFSGGGGGGGFGGRDRDSGFGGRDRDGGFSAAEGDGQWGRGGGGGGGGGSGGFQQPARAARQGFDGPGVSFGRADNESSWERGAGQQPAPEFRGSGFAGGSGPPVDEPWSRGAGQPQPELGPRRGGGFGGDSRADEEASWSKGVLQGAPQPVAGPSRADEEPRWGRTSSSQALAPLADTRPSLREVDVVDDWKKGKPGKGGSVRGGSVAGGSQGGGSDGRADENAPVRNKADEAELWRNIPAASSQLSQPPASAADASCKRVEQKVDVRAGTSGTWEKAVLPPKQRIADEPQNMASEDDGAKEVRGEGAGKWTKKPPVERKEKVRGEGQRGRGGASGSDSRSRYSPRPGVLGVCRVWPCRGRHAQLERTCLCDSPMLARLIDVSLRGLVVQQLIPDAPGHESMKTCLPLAATRCNLRSRVLVAVV